MLSIIIVSIFSLLLQGDTTKLERVPLHERIQRTSVEFITPQVKGDDYCRPVGRSQQAISHRSLLSSQVDVDSILTTTSNCESNQQVHITLGNDVHSMIISFISNNSSIQSRVVYSLNKDAILSQSSSSSFTVMVATNSEEAVTYSQLLYVTDYLISPAMGSPSQTNDYVISLQNTSTWAYDKVTKEHWGNYHMQDESTATMGFGLYSNPYMYYDSPFIHTVTLNNLKQGEMYYYQPDGSCKIFHFTLPRTSTSTSNSHNADTTTAIATRDGEVNQDNDMYPFTIGMVVDLGQTMISNASITALIAIDPDVVLLAGDLSYADGWTPLWDSFGELIEPLAAHVPLLTTGGNHEFSSGESWLSYSARYPTPHRQSGSRNFGYWGREIGGGVHVIALNSYAGYSSTSHQYKWLINYLKTRIDRVHTPWLIVMMHVPLYNTNTGHWKEGELFRLSIEPLLYQYGVDIILAGHVHAYERTHEVYNNVLNPCGFVHLMMGDGGNYEGAYVPWRDLTNNKDAAWSAFREASFGVAEVKVLSDTQIHFSWFRHACQSSSTTHYGQNFSDACVTVGDNSAQKMMIVDPVIISKPSRTQCPNRWKSSENLVTSSSSSSSSNNQPSVNNNSLSGSTTIRLLSLFIIILLFCCSVLAVLLILEIRKNQTISITRSNNSDIHNSDNKNNIVFSTSSSGPRDIDDSYESLNPLLPSPSLLSPSSLNTVVTTPIHNTPTTTITTTNNNNNKNIIKSNNHSEFEYSEMESGLNYNSHTTDHLIPSSSSSSSLHNNKLN